MTIILFVYKRGRDTDDEDGSSRIRVQVSHAASITRYATAINSPCNQNAFAADLSLCLSHVQHSASTGSRVHQKHSNWGRRCSWFIGQGGETSTGIASNCQRVCRETTCTQFYFDWLVDGLISFFLFVWGFFGLRGFGEGERGLSLCTALSEEEKMYRYLILNAEEEEEEDDWWAHLSQSYQNTSKRRRAESFEASCPAHVQCIHSLYISTHIIW